MSIQPEQMIAAACQATGLDDFGSDSFREGLAVLCESLSTGAQLTAIGQQALPGAIVGALGNRLRVTDWIKQHPDKGMPFLQELYQEWPFFRTLLSNMDMVPAKSSIAIASRDAELVTDHDLRQHILARIKAEWPCSTAALLASMTPERLRQGPCSPADCGSTAGVRGAGGER